MLNLVPSFCWSKPFHWAWNRPPWDCSETSSPEVRSGGCSPGRASSASGDSRRFLEATESTCYNWDWAPPSLQGLQSPPFQDMPAHYYSNGASSNVSNISVVQTNFRGCSLTTLDMYIIHSSDSYFILYLNVSNWSNQQRNPHQWKLPWNSWQQWLREIYGFWMNPFLAWARCDEIVAVTQVRTLVGVKRTMMSNETEVCFHCILGYQ